VHESKGAKVTDQLPPRVAVNIACIEWIE